MDIAARPHALPVHRFKELAIEKLPEGARQKLVQAYTDIMNMPM